MSSMEASAGNFLLKIFMYWNFESLLKLLLHVALVKLALQFTPNKA